MHRRQLLARVMTTGLVLVGGARLIQAQRTGPISAAEIQILLQAYDEASAKFRSGPPYFVGDLGQAFAGRFEMTQRPRVGQKRVISVPSGVTGIDYESMAAAIARAVQQMPPPRVTQ